MKIPRLLGKFSGPAYSAGVVLLLSACAGSDPGTSGNTSQAGSGAAGANGAAGSGPSSGGSSAMGTGELLGAFEVSFDLDEQDATKGLTQVLGKVSDKPLPPRVIWSTTKEDGDCHLETPTVPFCDPGCGADICAEGGVCVAYPVGHSVGEVTLSGVQLESGGSELVLKEIKAAYQAPAGTVFAFPPFAEGDQVELHAAGGEYPGFDAAASAVAPISFTSSDFALDEGKALELTWPAASDRKASSVHVKLDISHHGGAVGLIECDADDTGSLTISADLITELIGLGVAGFPSIELTRRSSSIVSIAPGRVQFIVSSKVGQMVTVAGYESCNADTCDGTDSECVPCPDGMTCQSDLTCM